MSMPASPTKTERSTRISFGHARGVVWRGLVALLLCVATVL